MEPLDVAKKINFKINELEEIKKTLQGLAEIKSQTIINYEKTIAKESLRLANENYAISLIDKFARGACADLKGEMDLAESKYKNQIKIIDITTSQLNGYQSINRYLSEL